MQEPGTCVDLGTCVDVTITHIAQELPSNGTLQWCVPVQMSSAPPLPPAAAAPGGGDDSGGSTVDGEGCGENGGGDVSVCTTWEELHGMRQGRLADKLMWPLAGIALHPPSFKAMSADRFISVMGAVVFEKF